MLTLYFGLATIVFVLYPNPNPNPNPRSKVTVEPFTEDH